MLTLTFSTRIFKYTYNIYGIALLSHTKQVWHAWFNIPTYTSGTNGIFFSFYKSKYGAHVLYCSRCFARLPLSISIYFNCVVTFHSTIVQADFTRPLTLQSFSKQRRNSIAHDRTTKANMPCTNNIKIMNVFAEYNLCYKTFKDNRDNSYENSCFTK